MYERDIKRKYDEMLAYLKQLGIIDYNKRMYCRNGHAMTLKPNTKTDGWWWRCAVRGCQKTKSLRTDTFFFENKLDLFLIFLIIMNFAFEFLNTTIHQLVGVCENTISSYKKITTIFIIIFN